MEQRERRQQDPKALFFLPSLRPSANLCVSALILRSLRTIWSIAVQRTQRETVGWVIDAASAFRFPLSGLRFQLSAFPPNVPLVSRFVPRKHRFHLAPPDGMASVSQLGCCCPCTQHILCLFVPRRPLHYRG